MRLFPLFHDLQGRRAVVVGGTMAAASKARLLLGAGAAVTLVASGPMPEIAARAAASLIVHRRALRAWDFGGAALAFIATGDPAGDAAAAALARAAGVPVNVVDRPGLSDFQMPAIVDREPVLVAISTGGAAPALARWLRGRIEAALPSGLARLVAFAARLRPRLARQIADPAGRRRAWESVLDGPAGALALAGRQAEAEVRLQADITAAAPQGIVHIVGAGPGDPDLLTLKAHRLLQQADVVVHDRLIGAGVLELARREAERIDVGKASGAHRYSQTQINALLVRLARQGKRVVRLKGGDPFVFGRGGEELAYLRANGIAAEVVPGITAAIGAAASAGIALTQRGLASAVTLLTGHGSDGLDGVDWQQAARPGQTLAIYMGRENGAALARRLMQAGLAPHTPVAVIENATLPAERRWRACLADLGETLIRQRVTGPTLILVGEVVAAADADAPADAMAAS